MEKSSIRQAKLLFDNSLIIVKHFDIHSLFSYMVHCSYQILADYVFKQVSRVLTFDAFFNVTCQLMKSENSLIRKKVIELMGEKIKSSQEIGNNEVCLFCNFLVK